jgi:energy-coupling factor transport system permease protein
MTLIPVAVTADADAVLARLDPVAKLAAAAFPALALLVSFDLVTSGIILAGTLATVPGWGVGWRDIGRRLWPLWLGALTIAVGTSVFTDRKGGIPLVDLGPVLVTSDSVLAGLTAGLRIAAIALPGVLAVMSIDPVDLADSLVVHLRVPARFAYGSLAAFRLAPLLAIEWEVLGRARRARGLEAGRNPATAARLFAGKVFALLVGAVRRGTLLATAMDARGFDAAGTRTCARTPAMSGADIVLVVAAGALSAVAVAVAMAVGAWDPVLW